MKKRPDTSQAATDVQELISDMDGGIFEQILSIALSQVAIAVTNHEKKGSVNLNFDFESIKGTGQVRLEHKLTYKKPTGSGRTMEETNGATVLHVGRNGALSLTQPSLLPADTQVELKTTPSIKQ